MFEETLAQMRTVLGQDHPNTLVTVTSLGANYLSAGQPEKALPLLEGALQQCKQNLGPTHPTTLLCMNNLAGAYERLQRYADELPLLEECYRLAKESMGPEHPQTLTAMGNLACLYRYQARYAEAELLFTQVLEIQRRVLGPAHASTLTSMNNLAVLYSGMNKLTKSVPLFEETLDLLNKVLGEDHPQTLQMATSLGMDYVKAGRLDDALPLLEACYRASKNDHSLHWVGALLLDAYVRSAQVEKAKAFAGELLTETRVILPKDSPQLATSLRNIARLLIKLSSWSDAETAIREALSIGERGEPDDWGTYNLRFMLGQALLGQQRYGEAEPLLVQGHEGLKQREEKIPPIQRAHYCEAIERLVQLYEVAEKPDEAARWRNELEAMKKRLADTSE